MTDEDEWVDAEWVLQQDAQTAPLALLLQGLSSRIRVSDLSSEGLPLTELDRLEQAISDLVIAFEEGELEIEDTTGGESDAPLTIYHVHLRLRRSELKLVEGAVATAVGFLTSDTTSGLINALNLVRTLIAAASWLSVAERNAVSFVLTNQCRGITTRRDDLTPYGIDVDNLVQKGVFVQSNDGLSVSA